MGNLLKRLRYPIIPAVEGALEKAISEREEAADRMEFLENGLDRLEERLAIQNEEVLSLERELEGLGDIDA